MVVDSDRGTSKATREDQLANAQRDTDKRQGRMIAYMSLEVFDEVLFVCVGWVMGTGGEAMFSDTPGGQHDTFSVNQIIF